MYDLRLLTYNAQHPTDRPYINIILANKQLLTQCTLYVIDVNMYSKTERKKNLCLVFVSRFTIGNERKKENLTNEACNSIFGLPVNSSNIQIKKPLKKRIASILNSYVH